MSTAPAKVVGPGTDPGVPPATSTVPADMLGAMRWTMPPPPPPPAPQAVTKLKLSIVPPLAPLPPDELIVPALVIDVREASTRMPPPPPPAPELLLPGLPPALTAPRTDTDRAARDDRGETSALATA